MQAAAAQARSRAGLTSAHCRDNQVAHSTKHGAPELLMLLRVLAVRLLLPAGAKPWSVRRAPVSNSQMPW